MLVPKSFSDLITFSRASAGWYFDSTGRLVQAAANVPRFDYDPVTRQPRGLLIEEARTNALINSLLQGAAAGQPGTIPTGWTTTAAFQQGTSEVGPSKCAGGNRVRYSVTGGRQFIEQQLALPASSTCWFHVDVDVTAGTTIGLIISTINTTASVTLSWLMDGVEVQGTHVVSPGRHKLAMRIVVGSTGGTTGIRMGVGTAGSTTGDVEFDCPQFELGSFPTSYIPTGGAQATRAADVASVSNTDAFASVAGTVLCEGEIYGESSIAPRAWQLRTPSGDWVQGLARLSTNNVIAEAYVGGVYQASLYMPLAANHRFKSAFAWAQDDFAASTDGGAPLKDTSGSVPVFGRSSTLWLGRDSGTSRYLNGWIRSLRYWPYRLSNAELQALTA